MASSKIQGSKRKARRFTFHVYCEDCPSSEARNLSLFTFHSSTQNQTQIEIKVGVECHIEKNCSPHFIINT